MKNIGVIIYDLATEYNYTVVNGIVSYFEKRKDVRVVISTVKMPHDPNGFFDYQFWTSVELLKCNEIDGYITVPNSFSNCWDFNELAKSLEDLTKKPVVNVAIPLNLPGSHSVCVSCENSFEQIVSHIINKHNKTKIAFFSAELSYSPEANKRLQAYISALEKNGLAYNPEFVLPGDFTPGTAREYILSHFIENQSLPFEAIICANDHTAVGCMTAFEKLGINCPKDILIFGYDDSPIASKSHPTISTINQFIQQNGFMSAKMLDDLINKNFVSLDKYRVDSFPVYRQSCGCVDCSIQTNAYIDKNGIFHGIDKRQITEEYNISLASSDNISNIYQLLNLADTYTTFDALKYSINPILDLTKIQSLSVCLYKDVVELNLDDDFVLPENAYVASLISKDKKLNLHMIETENREYFNPKETLVPEDKKLNVGGTYYLIPLFLRNKNYGYMLCKYNTKNTYIIPLFSKILTNAIILCYENQRAEKVTSRLIENTENLDFQAKTDELTGLFNRRGFLEFGDRLIDLSLAVEKEGLVFFCDMDGLKKINDTYGHKVGDLAIKTQATILQKSFRESDLVGRLSGDEFGVVAPGYKVEKLQELRDKICEISKEESKKAELPFTLSISVGYEEFFEDHCRLQDLLISADKRLYEEKLIKHGK